MTENLQLFFGPIASWLSRKSIWLSRKSIWPEICEYPDSGKCMAEGSMDREQPFEVIAKIGNNLGYWDGEP